MPGIPYKGSTTVHIEGNDTIPSKGSNNMHIEG